MAHMLAIPHRSPADHYTQTARSAARRVLRSYSTSFALASSALPRRIRTHIEAVYAMVRVADELVDGAWTTGTPEDVRHELDRFEAVIARAAAEGFSTDLVAHAFGVTARRTGIGPRQWEPFFASMRSDIPTSAHTVASTPDESALLTPTSLTPEADPGAVSPETPDASAPESPVRPAPLSPDAPTPLTPDALRRYVHGSAEVVGEMCVLAFFDGAPLPADAEEFLLPGARTLGSAFQKVNFLRDIAHDSARLGRGYLVAPGRAATDFTEEEKDRLVAEVFTELADAAPAVDALPRSVRPAVWTAFGVFADLTHRIAETPAHRVAQDRVRVPDPVKLSLAARAAAGRPRTSWPGMPVRCSRRSA